MPWCLHVGCQNQALQQLHVGVAHVGGSTQTQACPSTSCRMRDKSGSTLPLANLQPVIRV